MSPLSNEEVVAAFLQKIEGLTLREAQDLTLELLGGAEKIDHQAISSYRSGKWKRLYPPARRKLERILDLVPAKESPTYAQGVEYVAGRLSALVDDLARITGPSSAPRPKPKADGMPSGPEALKRRFLSAIEEFSDLQVEEICGINHETVRQYRQGDWPVRGPNRASTEKILSMIKRYEAILEEKTIIARQKLPPQAAGLIEFAEDRQGVPAFVKKYPDLGWIYLANELAKAARNLDRMTIYDEFMWLGYKRAHHFDPEKASRVTPEDVGIDVSEFFNAADEQADSNK